MRGWYLFRCRLRRAWLLNRHYTIGGHILQYLKDATRPANFHLSDPGVASQSEMHPTVAAGCVTDGRRDRIPLREAVRGDDVDLGADCHTITLGSNQVAEDPMVMWR